MIVDSLNNAAMYYGLGERFEKALRYLRETDFDNVQPGRYEIDGSRVFALVQHYETKPREKGAFEAHQQYCDIQYVYAGAELMGYANLGHLKAGQYDQARDFTPAEGQPEYFELRAGSFALLAPQDAHIPQIAVQSPQAVKKVVMKVAV